ncbi:MAG: glycosyltransferase [Acidimicrobiia bacterium]|nr:glycosyltransferase [Acidimicrobiia bacterium]
MRWVVASPYFEAPTDQWIVDAVDPGRHTFTLIPRVGEDRNWHQSSAKASPKEWVDRMRQARAAFAHRDAGVVSVFPQLAAACGLLKLVGRDRRPLVSWMFNTEGLHTPVKQRVARIVLEQVDRFVVHTTIEIGGYSALLGLPEKRFEFVPFQYGGVVETARPDTHDEPYVFATGSGYRDYETFFEAMSKLGLRTLVLASDRALDGLTVPSNVTILDQLTRPEIRRLVRHARVNVIPLNDQALTAGLVTIVETFRHGRAVVITNRPGLEDYVFEGKNALCSELYDAKSMVEAIDAMWSDDELRAELDANAERFGEENCTDAAVGTELIRILDDVS